MRPSISNRVDRCSLVDMVAECRNISHLSRMMGYKGSGGLRQVVNRLNAEGIDYSRIKPVSGHRKIDDSDGKIIELSVNAESVTELFRLVYRSSASKDKILPFIERCNSLGIIFKKEYKGHAKSIAARSLNTISKNELQSIVSNSRSGGEVLSKLGYVGSGRSNALYSRMKAEGIDHSHFKYMQSAYKARRNAEKARPYSEVMVFNSDYPATYLKRRLIGDGILKYKCDVCGNDGSWNGLGLTLEMDHINGINNDHRLENLRILCPNCHSQTDTFRAGSVGVVIDGIHSRYIEKKLGIPVKRRRKDKMRDAKIKLWKDAVAVMEVSGEVKNG